MITHQCQRCIELAAELRIVRANHAQMCKDFDRRNELVESLEAKISNRVDTKPNIASPARQQNLEATCFSFWGMAEETEVGK